MIRALFLSVLVFGSFQSAVWADFSAKGRVSGSLLYLLDNFESTSVFEVYTNGNCSDPGELIQIVFGKEIDAVDCSARCCRQRVLRGDELVLERFSEEGDPTSIRQIGSSLYSNLHLSSELKKDRFSLKINGRLSQSLMNDRSLYGTNRPFYQFSNLYLQYENLDGRIPFQVSLGRRALGAGAIVDGLSLKYFFGPSTRPNSKSVGGFFGLAPQPVTKKVSQDRLVFGLNFQWISDFSQTSESKFFFDSTLVGETFKGDLNRLSLQTRSHFTPLRELSLILSSTTELPAKGDSGALKSGYLSLQTLFRPQPRVNLSLALTQFRIDRFLIEDSVRNPILDDIQADRVGLSLDRSHRYRADFRAALKLSPQIEIYQRSRLERRTFDPNKQQLNNPDLPFDKEDRDEAPENVRLLTSPTAYQVAAGLRAQIGSKIDTESRITYRKHYLSRSQDIWQNLSYALNENWLLDFDFQAVRSSREIPSSVPAADGNRETTLDFYAGLGASYQIRQNLLGRLRYDLAYERDHSLQNRLLTHSAFARIDYRF